MLREDKRTLTYSQRTQPKVLFYGHLEHSVLGYFDNPLFEHRLNTGPENNSCKCASLIIFISESLVFWLNVIYMFASINKDVQPHMLLVGTHADKLPSKDRETIIKEIF